jgi:hypothetical protein
MQDVHNNRLKFNSQGDSRYFKEEELGYILEMFD